MKLCPGLKPSLTTNRTTLELKPSQFIDAQTVSTLPIAPHWNWNPDRSARSFRAPCYQSHHTGIETIKRCKRMSSGVVYQSHHTGIETDVVHRCQARLNNLPIAPHWNWNTLIPTGSKDIVTTNRTTLELKPKTNGPWMRNLNYQSHHTGIET